MSIRVSLDGPIQALKSPAATKVSKLRAISAILAATTLPEDPGRSDIDRVKSILLALSEQGGIVPATLRFLGTASDSKEAELGEAQLAALRLLTNLTRLPEEGTVLVDSKGVPRILEFLHRASDAERKRLNIKPLVLQQEYIAPSTSSSSSSSSSADAPTSSDEKSETAAAAAKEEKAGGGKKEKKKKQQQGGGEKKEGEQGGEKKDEKQQQRKEAEKKKEEQQQQQQLNGAKQEEEEEAEDEKKESAEQTKSQPAKKKKKKKGGAGDDANASSSPSFTVPPEMALPSQPGITGREPDKNLPHSVGVQMACLRIIGHLARAPDQKVTAALRNPAVLRAIAAALTSPYPEVLQIAFDAITAMRQRDPETAICVRDCPELLAAIGRLVGYTSTNKPIQVEVRSKALILAHELVCDVYTEEERRQRNAMREDPRPSPLELAQLRAETAFAFGGGALEFIRRQLAAVLPFGMQPRTLNKSLSALSVDLPVRLLLPISLTLARSCVREPFAERLVANGFLAAILTALSGTWLSPGKEKAAEEKEISDAAARTFAELRPVRYHLLQCLALIVKLPKERWQCLEEEIFQALVRTLAEEHKVEGTLPENDKKECRTVGTILFSGLASLAYDEPSCKKQLEHSYDIKKRAVEFISSFLDEPNEQHFNNFMHSLKWLANITSNTEKETRLKHFAVPEAPGEDGKERYSVPILQLLRRATKFPGVLPKPIYKFLWTAVLNLTILDTVASPEEGQATVQSLLELMAGKDPNEAEAAAAAEAAAKGSSDTATATAAISSCAVCGKPAAQQCSKCRAVSYCSREHQVQDWKKHKQQCVARPTASPQGEAANATTA